MALGIPSSVPVADYGIPGSTLNLSTQSWFTATKIDLQSNVTVLTALFTNNALLIVLKNTGNSNVTISGLSLLAPGAESPNLQTIVTTITTVSTITQYVQNFSAKAPSPHDFNSRYKSYQAFSNAEPSALLPLSAYQTAATFLVQSNGQIVQPSSGVNPQQLGLVLEPGENASLTFIGNIQTLNSLGAPYSPLPIIPGSPYILEIQGPFAQPEEINVTAIAPF